MWGGMDPKQCKRWEQVLTGSTCYRNPEGQFRGARSPSEVLDEAGVTSLFFAPDKTEEQSPSGNYLILELEISSSRCIKCRSPPSFSLRFSVT